MPKIPQPLTIILGKSIRNIAKMRGGGSALPGLFIEKINPSFVPSILKQISHGVVVISGTNGKTTTTKMVVSLLESQGLRVFTNKTGSNLVRGIAAALLGEINLKGKLDADIAVLELDEAHAVKFVEIFKPKYSLLLNVMRDQLDRFGEIDTTAKLLERVALNTTDSVVLNREDKRISAIKQKLPKTTNTQFFGLNPSLLSHFPNDEELHGKNTVLKKASTKPNMRTEVGTIGTSGTSGASIILNEFTNNTAEFIIDSHKHSTPLKINGIYNIYNSAAALALVKAILPNASINSLLKSLSTITPAFGRGETVIVDGQPLELVLVKNPAGFRLGLRSFSAQNYATMIAINDSHADGRDVSWLWDVDFTSLKDTSDTTLSSSSSSLPSSPLSSSPSPTSSIYVTGVRAYDMALRLQYDEVPVEHIETSLKNALTDFIAKHKNTPKRIYCTYTAMLALRKELAKISVVEKIQ